MNLFSQLFGTPVKSVNPPEVIERLNQKPRPYLLDVRQPDEYRQGHIPGAKLIPLSELPKRARELPKDREIVCICRSGNRSASAAKHLASAGYSAVNMSGGMIAWSRNSLPVKTGNKA